jgi:hypothetical protein
LDTMDTMDTMDTLDNFGLVFHVAGFFFTKEHFIFDFYLHWISQLWTFLYSTYLTWAGHRKHPSKIINIIRSIWFLLINIYKKFLGAQVQGEKSDIFLLLFNIFFIFFWDSKTQIKN